MFSVNVTGDVATEANLLRLAAGVGPLLGQALEVGMLPGSNLAKQFAPYRTGNLRRSIHAAIVAITAASAEGQIGTNLEYAPAQEYGATIVPVNAKMLHWVDPVTGEDVFAHQVTLPPQPYMRPALDQGWPLMVAETGRAFGILISQAAMS
jgi:hypothetical protein